MIRSLLGKKLSVLFSLLCIGNAMHGDSLNAKGPAFIKNTMYQYPKTTTLALGAIGTGLVYWFNKNYCNNQLNIFFSWLWPKTIINIPDENKITHDVDTKQKKQENNGNKENNKNTINTKRSSLQTNKNTDLENTFAVYI